MSYPLTLILSLALALTACKVETTPDPKVKLNGHWIVDHGLFGNECQVGATFTDAKMILTFNSLVAGACQQELYGIQNSAISLDIDHRADYVDAVRNPTANLAVSLQERQVEGEILLTQNPNGLSGEIVFANDPDGLLEQLVGIPYELMPIDEDWYELAKGLWAGFCEDPAIIETPSTPEFCLMMEFTDMTRFQVLAAGSPDSGTQNFVADVGNEVIEIPGEPDPLDAWDTNIFAPKDISKISENEFTISAVIFLEESEESFEIELQLESDRLIMLPIDPDSAIEPTAFYFYPARIVTQ